MAEPMVMFRYQPCADGYLTMPVAIPYAAPTGMAISATGESMGVLTLSSVQEDWLRQLIPGSLGPVQLAPTEPAEAHPVVKQLEEIQQITELTDQQVAEALPGGVSRETVNRWRHATTPNLRRPNLYSLGALHTLAQHMEQAKIDAPVWLHQPIVGQSDTPYELLTQGRLGDVRASVEALALGGDPTAPMRMPTLHRGWDEAVGEDEDDNDDADEE